jgi:hypothetical protein
MRRRKSQVHPSLYHVAIWSGGRRRQADTWDRPRQWFFRGLERFVNTGDSAESYEALAKAFPSFWPLPLEDNSRIDLSWRPEAERVFKFYRDLLRGFWTRNPAPLQDVHAIDILFGTLSDFDLDAALSGKESQFSFNLSDALAPLRFAFPELRPPNPTATAKFSVNWQDGAVEYVSQMDFQRAVWFLFRESWRAKVCPKCSMYFIAEKPPQLYCSLSCSSAAHRASSLDWWKKKGSQKRDAKSRAKQAERKSR